jgi:hypothetical protein
MKPSKCKWLKVREGIVEEQLDTGTKMLLQVMVDLMKTKNVITVVKVVTVMNVNRNVLKKKDMEAMMIQTTPTNAPYR